MKFSTSCVIVLSFIQTIREVSTYPVAQQSDNEDYEERRRRKIKKRRRPCARSAEEARWFFGHDLTLFLGDVTICGTFPEQNNQAHSSNLGSNTGSYEGVVPALPVKPQRPHKPHKPFRPFQILNQIFPMNIRPVHEDVNEDIQDDYYKPGPLVGVPNNQIVGLEQNLSNFHPSRIISTLSRHLNKIVDPFIDLFYK